MVEKADVYKRECRLKRLCDALIRATRLGDSAWVVVIRDRGDSIQLKPAPYHLAGVHRRLSDRASEQLFHGDEGVLRVEPQHAEHLELQGCQPQSQQILDIVWAVQLQGLAGQSGFQNEQRLRDRPSFRFGYAEALVLRRCRQRELHVFSRKKNGRTLRVLNPLGWLKSTRGLPRVK